MLPHLAGRPPTLVRAPGRAGRHPLLREELPVAPSGVGRGLAGLRGDRQHPGLHRRRAWPTLVWLANLAAIELHTHQWTHGRPDHPTALVIDLDPGAPATIVDCCRVALELRDTLEQLGLGCVVKTSGGKGLHLSVPLIGSPLHRRRDQAVRARARATAGAARPEASARRHGEGEAAGQGVRRLEPERPAQDDGVRVLVALAATHPTVSTPLSWDEVQTLDRPRTRVRSKHAMCPSGSMSRRPLRRRRSNWNRRLPVVSGSAHERRRRKVAIISRTGASRGVGAATAELLAAKGCTVVCAARATDTSPLPIPGTIDDTVRRISDAGGTALAIPTNLAQRRRDRTLRATTIDQFGGVDILVNNAAITFPGDLDMEMKRFDLVMQVDLRAPAHHDQGRDALDEGARRRLDRQRVVGRGAELHRRVDGVRNGEGRARTPHGLGRASARAVRHRGQHVPHRRARRVGRIRLQHARRRPLRLGTVGGRSRRHRVDDRAAGVVHAVTTKVWPSLRADHGIMPTRPGAPTPSNPDSSPSHTCGPCSQPRTCV